MSDWDAVYYFAIIATIGCVAGALVIVDLFNQLDAKDQELSDVNALLSSRQTDCETCNFTVSKELLDSFRWEAKSDYSAFNACLDRLLDEKQLKLVNYCRDTELTPWVK